MIFNDFFFSFLLSFMCTFQAAPKSDWKTPVEVWTALHQAEQFTTAAISKIMDVALDKKDHATYSFLKEYIDEQVSSEDEILSILEKVKAYGALPGLLYHLDHELEKSAGKPLI